MSGFKEYQRSSHLRHNAYDEDLDMWDGQYRPEYNLSYNDDINSQTNIQYSNNFSPDPDVSVQKYFGLGIGIVSLVTKNLISHPFVVLRRQCQVHNTSRRYHLLPVSLIPVIAHLHQRQGLTTLWKGLGSVLLVRGMTLAVEDVISKLTPWPKDMSWHSSLKSIGQHVLLKCVSLGLVMPFFSASLVETVQSDIASEKPGVLDVFREGATRLVGWQRGRMLPVWALLPPTIAFGLVQYLFSLIVRTAASQLMHARYKQKRGATPKDLISNSALQDIELDAALIAMVTSEVAFYPLETVIHRLHLQGTRTIIDNLDTGLSVVPILTNYEGASDCYESIISTEGMSGLYKGFGALILQLATHVIVVRLTSLLLNEISAAMKPSTSPTTTIKTTQVPTQH